MPNQIRASVIIATKGRLNRLVSVLKVLGVQMTPEVEVLVIFDGCESRVLEQVAALDLGFTPCLIYNKENLGMAASRNKGIDRARGEIIIFLDDDCIPGARLLATHIAGHKEDCVFIGVRKYLRFREEEITTFKSMSPAELYRRFTAVFKAQAGLPKEKWNIFVRIIWMLFGRFLYRLTFTTNSSVSRKHLIAVGGFDENFTGYGYEDMEMGYRLARRGLPFRRDFSLMVYHLEHPVDKRFMVRAMKKNYRYFMRKLSGDYFYKFLLMLLQFTFEKIMIRTLF